MLTKIVLTRRISGVYMHMYVVCMHISLYIFTHMRIHARLHICTQVRLSSFIYDKFRYKTYYVAHIRMLLNINRS